MKNKRVIILNSEVSNTLPFIWYYNKIGYKVIVGSNTRFSIGFFSKYSNYKIYIPYPNINFMNDKNIRVFVGKIRKLCKKYNINLILSFYENTLGPIIKYKKLINVKNIFPSYTSYNILHDKSLFKEYLENFNFRSFYLPKSFNTNPKFPCVVKPNIGSGGEYVRICKNFNELKKYLKIIKLRGRKAIIEEYIPFQEKIAINILIDRKFRIKRALIMNYTDKNKIINAIYEVEDFLKRIKYFGFVSPQFIVKNGKLYLTEINPRLSYISYGIDFGIDFPEGFHSAIVENSSIEKKFFFISKSLFVGGLWGLSRRYIKIYKDPFPFLIMTQKYIRFKIEDKLKKIISKEYRNWIKIF
jgi:predicted ATP-grasp superfamily ATP-dependent carboligase